MEFGFHCKERAISPGSQVSAIAIQLEQLPAPGAGFIGFGLQHQVVSPIAYTEVLADGTIRGRCGRVDRAQKGHQVSI
jgi:hypothetical protein